MKSLPVSGAIFSLSFLLVSAGYHSLSSWNRGIAGSSSAVEWDRVEYSVVNSVCLKTDEPNNVQNFKYIFTNLPLKKKSLKMFAD